MTKSEALAAAVDTTPAFLTQALAPLVRTRRLRSAPGPSGGYELLPAGLRLSVLDVIEAVEGPTVAGRCVLRDGACAERDTRFPCALHETWSAARTSLVRELAAMPVIGSDLKQTKRGRREL